MVHGSLRIGVVYMAGVLAGDTRSLHCGGWSMQHAGGLNKSVTGCEIVDRLFLRTRILQNSPLWPRYEAKSVETKIHRLLVNCCHPVAVSLKLLSLDPHTSW